jgi:hypothetical protein
MKNLFCFLVVMFIFGCACKEKTIKNISCSGNVVLQYDKLNPSKNSKLVANKELKAFTVYFLYDFKDSIQGYVNNQLKFEKYLDLNANSDDLNDFFGYNYQKDIDIPTLKIISKTKNTCFDILIDKRYKVVAEVLRIVSVLAKICSNNNEEDDNGSILLSLVLP